MIKAWLILSVAMWVTTLLLPTFKIRGFGSAIVVAAVFGILNVLVGWLISLVFIVGTLGLGLLLTFVTHWVTNAVLLQLTQAVTDRVRIQGFGTALGASAIISVAATGMKLLLPGH
jgi:putative membrane protein